MVDKGRLLRSQVLIERDPAAQTTRLSIELPDIEFYAEKEAFREQMRASLDGLYRNFLTIWAERHGKK